MPSDRNKRRYNAYLSPKHHEKAEQYMLDDPVLPNPDIRGAKQEFTEKAILNFLNIASSNTEPSDNNKQEWLLQEKQEQISLLQQQVDDFRDRFNDITTEQSEIRRLWAIDKMTLAYAQRSWWDKLTGKKPPALKE